MASDRKVALLLWIGLMLVMVFAISSLIAFGLNGMMVRMPPMGSSDVLLTNAVFLYVIGATDFPERIRRSPALKRQILCWAILTFAFSLLVRPSLRSTMETYIGYFASALLMIALYSGGAVFRMFRKGSRESVA